MRKYENCIYGSLKQRFTACNEPFDGVSQPICCAADLQVGEWGTIRQLAYLLLLAALSCVSLALGGCDGNSLVGTSAQAGPLSASPSLVAFGSVPEGQSASTSISLKNSGQTAVQVTQVGVTGKAFSVSGVSDLPVSVGAGGTYQLSVNFSPQGTGTEAGQLTIASNASSEAMVIGLNGVGVSGSALSANTNAVAFGNVALNTVATQSITLSNGSTPVSISAATVAGTGFSLSGSTFPIVLSAGQATTLNVQFAPTVNGPATGTLTIVSTASSNPTTVVTLSGTGTIGGSYQVDLSWEAPTDSQDPVAGYEIYRSSSGASSYQLLTSSMLTNNSYVDNSVQSGQTYDYVVESVDASGVASAPSNIATVAIP